MGEVVIRDVTKIYPGDVLAVRSANLHINDKEFVVLVGPSGCGKSTTLRMVAGLEEITAGTIEIDERVVNDIPPKDRDIAMVFQNYALYPHMTVYKNMAFGLKLRRFSKSDIDERVQQAAKILDITELLERKPKQLSGGQRQRVAVGRAIVRQPKVFLFDEPLSNLDAKLRVEMRAELKKLHQRLQTTMVYVTHDQIEAMTLGDRIVIMNDGEIQQVDEPLNVYDYPTNRFVAGFIGTPPMNFLSGRLEMAGDQIWFKNGHMNLRMPEYYKEALQSSVSESVTVGVRPECMRELNGEDTPEGSAFEAEVNVIEPLGDQTLVYLSMDKENFIGRLDAHSRVQLNEKVKMELDMDKIHIFDDQTGDNLTLKAERN